MALTTDGTRQPQTPHRMSGTAVWHRVTSGLRSQVSILDEEYGLLNYTCFVLKHLEAFLAKTLEWLVAAIAILISAFPRTTPHPLQYGLSLKEPPFLTPPSLDGLLGSAFFLHCRNRAVLAKPLAFCNLREESSISCLGSPGAHPCGFLSSDICPGAPPPSVYLIPAFRSHTCISCTRVLAVCAYHTPSSFALFTTSNPISLFETVFTTTTFALSTSLLVRHCCRHHLAAYQESRFPLRVSSEGPFIANSNPNRNLSMAFVALC